MTIGITSLFFIYSIVSGSSFNIVGLKVPEKRIHYVTAFPLDDM